MPMITDNDLVETANAVAARFGPEEGEEALRFLRGTVAASKRNPLREDEAMALANEEVGAMRAERARKVKAGR